MSHVRCPALFLAKDAALSTFSVAKQTSIVVDSGYSCTTGESPACVWRHLLQGAPQPSTMNPLNPKPFKECPRSVHQWGHHCGPSRCVAGGNPVRPVHCTPLRLPHVLCRAAARGPQASQRGSAEPQQVLCKFNIFLFLEDFEVSFESFLVL